MPLPKAGERQEKGSEQSEKVQKGSAKLGLVSKKSRTKVGKASGA